MLSTHSGLLYVIGLSTANGCSWPPREPISTRWSRGINSGGPPRPRLGSLNPKALIWKGRAYAHRSGSNAWSGCSPSAYYGPCASKSTYTNKSPCPTKSMAIPHTVSSEEDSMRYNIASPRQNKTPHQYYTTLHDYWCRVVRSVTQNPNRLMSIQFWWRERLEPRVVEAQGSIHSSRMVHGSPRSMSLWWMIRRKVPSASMTCRSRAVSDTRCATWRQIS